MKGYKGFCKGLICNPANRFKQYEENTVFEESEAMVYNTGMHFCKSLSDVFDDYQLVDEDGEISEYADVESLDECVTENNKVFCTKKLRIGTKLNFTQMAREVINNSDNTDNGGIREKIINGENRKSIGITGKYAEVNSNGEYVKVASDGYASNISCMGYANTILTTGEGAKVSSIGGNSQIINSGNQTQIVDAGFESQIANAGDKVCITCTEEYARVANTGNYSQIISGSKEARINSKGDGVVICAFGKDSSVKASKGSWITLAEWEYDEGKGCDVPICVKTEYVDGERIKADAFYVLRNGVFTETI